MCVSGLFCARFALHDHQPTRLRLRGVSLWRKTMAITPYCLLLSCLRISPDRSQFFRYESVSLTCDDSLNSTGWKVKRRTSEGGVRPCASGWGSIPSGSSCTIADLYPSDSGVYWCESAAGERSNAVNVTVTGGSLILDSPALPVSEGHDVSLRCRDESNSWSFNAFEFYKDGVLIGSSSSGNMTVHSVSKADEGLYQCSVAGSERSADSWLSVRASPPSSSSAEASCSVSISRLVCHLAAGTPYLLSTVILGLIYRDRKRADREDRKTRGSSDVVMEAAV